MAKLFTRAALGLAGVAALAGTGFAASDAAAATALPFHDQNATASIGLCDAKGNPITSGSIDSHAFVTAAAASAPAPANYTPDKKAKATLYAFQPRQGVDPGEWSGFQLTGGSVFSDGQHPLVAGTNLDPSLREYMSAYAPRWDHLIQLRIYYTATNRVISRRSYPAAVLKVSGNTWTLVQGATNLHCDLAKVVSSERLLLPSSDFDPAHPAVTHPPAPAGASAAVLGTSAPATAGSTSSTRSSSVSTSVAGHSSAPASPASGRSTTAVADTTTTAKHSSSAGYWLLGTLAALGAAGLLVLRRVRGTRS